MRYKREVNGVEQPSRMDILKNVISELTGLDIMMDAGSGENERNLKNRDIRKRKQVNFNIKKID